MSPAAAMAPAAAAAGWLHLTLVAPAWLGEPLRGALQPQLDALAAQCERNPAHVMIEAVLLVFIAYILLAEKTDTNKASYSDGDYSMFISVSESDIKADEDANPVKTLRLRYDAWRKAKR